MRRLLIATVLALAALAPAASAQEMSSNVTRVATIPEAKSAISVNFIDNTMFVSTASGISAYSISDPTAPSLLGTLPMYIWENEDVDVDRKRKRLFISRDPRGFTSPATPGAAFPYGAVHIIDVSLPHAMTQIGFFTLPAGHTTTCVNGCDFIWTGGPYANADTQPDFVGRPIYSTDVTDPANPKACPDPIDTGRNDGVTDYAHDVQVDTRGIAWVSGAGGIRGYWTAGEHRNPVTGKTETATGCAPIPYGGSGTPDDATPSRFMHNAYREPDGAPVRKNAGIPVAAAVRARGARASRAGAPPASAAKAKRCSTRRGSKAARRRCALQRRCAQLRKRHRRLPKACRKATVKKPVVRQPAVPAPGPAAPALTGERVLYGTEENITSACASSGRFVAYDLLGTLNGEGFKDTKTTQHRMKVLDTFTPENQEGSTGCASAHYFASRGDGVFANSFYEQGVRFLDVSDPTNIRQIGWYRPADANVWAPYWYKGHAFVADFTRGIDVLKFTGSAASKPVSAPPLARAARRDDGLRFEREYLGGLCPLPAAAA